MARKQREKKLESPTEDLGDSWVVESEGDVESDGAQSSTSDPFDPSPSTRGVSRTLTASTASIPTRSKRRRSLHQSSKTEPSIRPGSQAASRQNADPQFIMPSIHEDGYGRSELTKRKGKSSETKSRRSDREGSTEDVAPTQESKGRASRRTNSTAETRLAGASEGVLNFIRPILNYMVDILGGALYTLKTPLYYLLAIYILVGIMVVLRNLLTRSIYTALSPICRIPGSSLLHLDMCKYPASNHPADATVELDELMTVQFKFEDVMAQAAGGVSLPFDMKRGEASIRDLRQVVRFSQVTSKNELVHEFDGFIDTARIASYDLQKFNSHVGHAVSQVITITRFTGRALEGIVAHKDSRGVVGSFFADSLLAPFQPIKFSENALVDQYILHTRNVEDEINRLVEEAQALLLVLQNLEDRLETIHGISLRDNLTAEGDREAIWKELWTYLGGNRSRLGKIDKQLELLDQVNAYRHSAFAHVSGTVLKLQEMKAELEVLRESAGSADSVGDRAGVPLSVHIETLRMGVERLETSREANRAVEGEYVRNILDRKNDREGSGERARKQPLIEGR